MPRNDIRIALPSKGALQQGTFDFLANCGLHVYRPNPRQYIASMPALPNVTVMFQRPGDIVAGVREGTIDFGISGWDIVAEKSVGTDSILPLHNALGYAPCTLNLAVPVKLPLHTMADLAAWATELEENGRILRIATKFPKVTAQMLEQHNVRPYKLVNVEGTLEIAPAIGFADIIADLVSSGVTLRDNQLRPLTDGQILASQACLIANRNALQTRPEVLSIAQQLLEYIEAHLRAKDSFQITANIRGDSPEAIALAMSDKKHIVGLQGPTISQVIPHNGENWFAINIIVHKTELFTAVSEIRAIGGSGVIVTPCAFIFEEEPTRYNAMLKIIHGK